MSGSLGTVIILFLLIFQFKRILGFLNLTKVHMRASEGRPVLRTRIPVHTRHLLETTHEALAALGFELIGAQAFETLNTSDPRSHTYSDFHWHPEQAVLAMAEPAPGLSGQATQVQFITMFSDGTSLMTVNRHQWEMMPVPGNITVLDALVDNLPAQWTFHLQAVAADKRARGVVTDKLRVLNRLEEVLTPRTMEHLVDIGWAHEESPGIYRLTARGAWHYSGQSRRRAKVAGEALTRPYKHDPQPSVEAVRIHEMHGAAANIELGAQPLPSWIKVALFAGTLALSVLVLGGAFRPMALAALFVVMFVHELGHFTAMWAFGYKNLSMFFLPFFGAAASGHKPHAPAWQESLVLLAGPVPGILLALAATQIPSDVLPQRGPEFLRWFVLFGLLINMFNLLPVGILDGGRLFQLAVLGRFPYLRAAFAGLGALAGLGYALYSGSRGLAVAMGITLVNMPVQFKAARATAAIHKKTRAAGQRKLGKDEVIHALGREFAHPDFGATDAKGWTQRLGIARLAYPRLLQGVPAMGTSIMALVLQGAAFLLPIVLVVWTLQQGRQVPLMHPSLAEQREQDLKAASMPEAIAERAARKKFMARYAAERDPVAKWKMLDHAAGADEDGKPEDSDTGVADLVLLDSKWERQQRAALLPQLPADHPGRLRYVLDTADGPGKTDAVLGVIAQLTAGGAPAVAKLDHGRFSLLMDAYAQLCWSAPPAVLADQAAMLDALWSELDAPGAPNADARARLAATRARVAFVSGDSDTAATWMERYVAAAGKDDDIAVREQGWFLLDIGRADAALAIAQRGMRDQTKPAITRGIWQTLAGWAEMSRGHARQADAYFQAVLKERDTFAAHARGAGPWWMRWSFRAAAILSPARAPHLDAATLDHLAALNAYDPAQAARLIADFRQGLKPEPAERPSGPYADTLDGWGKARAAAHNRLRQVIYAGIAPANRMPGGASAPAAK